MTSAECSSTPVIQALPLLPEKTLQKRTSQLTGLIGKNLVPFQVRWHHILYNQPYYTQERVMAHGQQLNKLHVVDFWLVEHSVLSKLWSASFVQDPTSPYSCSSPQQLLPGSQVRSVVPKLMTDLLTDHDSAARAASNRGQQHHQTTDLCVAGRTERACCCMLL